MLPQDTTTTTTGGWGWTRSTGVALAACGLAVLGLTACEPSSQLTIHNELKEQAQISHLAVGRPGATAVKENPGVVLPGATNPWAINLGISSGCHDDIEYIATTPSGKTYTYGPPVCVGGTWTIKDGSGSPGG